MCGRERERGRESAGERERERERDSAMIDHYVWERERERGRESKDHREREREIVRESKDRQLCMEDCLLLTETHVYSCDIY